MALAGPPARSAGSADPVRTWTIHYAAHNGIDRLAYVVLPSWYGPKSHPPIPLVISPHGRGATGRSNAELWGDLPAIGAFAVVSPDGMGRRLGSFSYGYSGQSNMYGPKFNADTSNTYGAANNTNTTSNTIVN